MTSSAAHAALKSPPFPHPLSYLWAHFIALRSGVNAGVTWQDVAAWTSLMKLELSPWECDALMRLDCELQKSRQPKKTIPLDME